MASFTEFAEEYKKKKKKEQEEAEKNTSFTEYAKDYTETEEDIAPVKDTSGWFKKSDGNFWETLGGSVGDVFTHIGAGILGMGEKIVDGLAAIAPYKEKTELEKFIKKDLYNEADIAKTIISDRLSYIGIDTENNSVFGDKSDALAQSGGELLGTAALSATGVPWWLTSAATAFGGETESALNEGATMEEAIASGFVSAGAEVLTEKIAGISFGGKTVGDAVAKKLSSGITSKFVKGAIKLGVDTAGEGFEEALTEDISAFGRWLTYQDENTLGEMFFSEEALQNKVDAFIGGAVLGGASNVKSSISAKIHGVDAVTGLTKNEQTVADSEYKNRVAEEEVDGKKLTNKQKNEIYDQVVDELKKGYISTDTIESVLGGDAYKSYQDTVKNEDAILKEFEELGKKQNPTLAEQSRYAELQEKVKEIQRNSQRDKLKSQLSQEVYNSLTRKVGKSGKNVQSDNYLIESYNESARRGQAFEADLSQYDEKTANVVKKAIDSKILNNTRKTHEFVDLVAKISADKGISFDFTNNENLKNSIFAVDGATVNGYVNADGITLNVQSAKALNSVVGHEITHVLEGTAFYGELQTAIFEYAKSKRDYDARRKALEDLYKSVKDADIDAELVADLVGDYLFTDPDFVRHLSTKNRNLFEKIYDEIKYLCKVVTAGSKEARKLEKAKKVFEEVYRESGKVQKNTANDGGVRYSITDNGGEIIDLSDDSELSGKVDGLHGAEKYKAIQNHILTVLSGKKIKLSDGKNAVVDNRDALHIANKSGHEKTAQIDKIKEIVEKAELYAEDTNVKHKKFNYFCYYEAYVRYKNRTYPLYLNVGRGINDGKYHIYDITKKLRDIVF